MRPSGPPFRPIFVLLISVALVSPASAQWLTQTLNLRQGWNAVFLEVQPQPAECDSIFANLPVDSVWMWNKHFSSVQYISDPNTLLPGQPNWLTYLKPANPKRPVANLFALQGGRPYLIKTTAAMTLSLRGQPLLRGNDWNADSFNLAGFYVVPSGAPNFQAFFAPSPAHTGQPMYRLSAAGTWQQITSPSATTLAAGESYWIRCAGPSSYSGFMNIIFEQGRGLDYGRRLVEQTLLIRNTSSNTTTFTVRKLASEAPPTSNYPALAGDVPLSYWRMNLATNQVGWVPLPAQLTSASIAPGGQWSLRLEVRRADMNSFSLPAGYASALYQSLLEVTDGQGSRQIVPVTANGLVAYNSLVPKADAGSTTSDPRAGLWVGSVVISKVNQAAVSDVPVPTASEYQFRLIVHVDTLGNPRLLQNVVLAWTNGVVTTNQQGFKQTVSPGRYALITDERLLSRFSGSAMRDGTVTGRRLSSSAFGFHDPIPIARNGSFGDTNATFSCNVALGFNDELNPFKHKYHPDHNNLDDRFASVKRECPDVTRQISFQFTPSDPENTTLAGWGDNQLGGVYNEVITGLHKAQLHVQGIFRLYRASTVPVLNDVPF